MFCLREWVWLLMKINEEELRLPRPRAALTSLARPGPSDQQEESEELVLGDGAPSRVPRPILIDVVGGLSGYCSFFCFVVEFVWCVCLCL